MGKLTKNKALAILLYDAMVLGNRKPTEFFMQTLCVNQKELATPISFLKNLSLIKTYDGSVNGGIEKVTDIQLDQVGDLLKVTVTDSLVQKCKEIVNESRQINYCDVCNESVSFLNRDNLCIDCVSLTQPILESRVARCGHISSTRYYKCVDCQPSLDEDDSVEYTIGSIENATSD